MPAYRAIFLDAGFTILHIHPSSAELFLRVTHDRGLHFSPQEARLAMQSAQVLFDAHYYQPNDTWADDAAIAEFWTAYYRCGLEALQCPPEVATPCAVALAASLNEPQAWEPYPEVPAVLADLQEAGYLVGILSDWSSSLCTILEALGLQQYVDIVVVSAVERVAKPNPAFFQRALDRTGVPASQALMVGDNLYADIRGAAQVGLRGILIDRAGRQNHADVPTIRRLDELWAHLLA